MQRIVGFCRRHRLPLAGVLLAALWALVLAWAGFDLSARVDSQPVYQIVNDEYSQTLSLQGVSQAVPLRAGQTLYGVRLDLTTYGHAFATGTLHAQLRQADGTPVVQAAVPCIELLDNTFAPLIFDAPYTAAADETLQLVLTADGFSDEEAGLPLGIWASEGVQTAAQGSGLDAALPLTGADGKPCNATAALQYVVDYSGRWSVVLSLVLGGLLFAAVVLGLVLLARRAAFWLVVLVCGALLGGALSKRMDNRAVEKLLMGLMLVIIGINVYNVIHYGMAAF